MSKFGKEVARLLKNDGDWDCSEYELTHRPTGLELWIGTGVWFFDASKFTGAMGLFERHWIWHTVARPLVKLLKPRKPSASENRAEAWKKLRSL